MPWQDGWFALVEVVSLLLLLWQARDRRTRIPRAVSLLYVGLSLSSALVGLTLGWTVWPLVAALAAVLWLALAVARAPAPPASWASAPGEAPGSSAARSR